MSQNKESLERHNDSLKNKRSAKFVALLVGVLGCKSSSKKTCWLTKHINPNKKARKYVAFLTGGEDWLNVIRPAKHTLVLIKVLRI